MSNRRLIPLGLGAVALLAIVALAARGGALHPSGGGTGPSTLFWSYAFTMLLMLPIFGVIALIWVFVFLRPDLRAEFRAGKSSPARTARILIFVLAFSGLLFYVLRRLHKSPNFKPVAPIETRPGVSRPGDPLSTHYTFQWWVLVAVLVLAAVAGAIFFVERKRRGQNPRRPLRTAPETVAAALDESLDDLRNDPDLRRAIVAAYARMEWVLAAVGLPRDQAEAPLEYLERVLLSLDASADAVRRLTDLFEWARFSHHEPEPSMRDEAVDALIAVRDELRNEELQPA